MNGRDENGNRISPDDAKHADNIWWWPNTRVMDAGKKDVLKFFGMTLTGGAEGLPALIQGPLLFMGGGGGDLGAYFARQALNPKHIAEGRLFTDNFAIWMNYVFKLDKHGDLKLYVFNGLTGLMSLFTDVDFTHVGDDTSIAGAMRIDNFSFPAHDAVTDQGELLSLEALGIAEISLAGTALNHVTPQGTRLLQGAANDNVSPDAQGAARSAWQGCAA